MTIQDGVNGKPTHINIHGRDNGLIEIWIEQTGLLNNPKPETLSYMTADELLTLIKEAKQAFCDLAK